MDTFVVLSGAKDPPEIHTNPKIRFPTTRGVLRPQDDIFIRAPTLSIGTPNNGF
jgi:hypothetical protein